MAADSSPELSETARKLAAQQVARYCEELSQWRKTKQGREAVDKSLRARGMLVPFPAGKSHPSTLDPSA